jgi:hypothetical protein
MDISLTLQVLSYDPSFWVELVLLAFCIFYLVTKLFFDRFDVVSSDCKDSQILYRGLRKNPEQVLSKFRSINKNLKVGALISVKEVA